MNLNIAWFILIFVLLSGYAILDGFDFGVGVLHLLGRSEKERRVSINAIGPVWDGNEVWLLTGGGALFAAFPPVYATVFSAAYLALMLLLVALIFRAIAIEFRNKVDSSGWRKLWDVLFSLGSILPPVLLGVAFGNILRGLPLDDKGDFAGSFLGLLNPFSVLVGVLTLVLFTMHGATYLACKSDETAHQRCRKIIPLLWSATGLLFAGATLASVKVSPFLFDHLRSQPLTIIFAALFLLAFLLVPVFNANGRTTMALICSSASIAAMMGLASVSLFPRLVPSSINLDYSLTIYNSSSTPRTLLVMLVIAGLGMPLVIAYTAIIYRIFRGRVVLHGDSY